MGWLNGGISMVMYGMDGKDVDGKGKGISKV